ncbi:hypothetical protein V9T40_011417 [Parthenolecanium corni]|uniref:SOCS box domain-containing protein n=1 Tax=Parthenolecanium corni TaxID=536013 RepID=A0AAN9XY55_9HEMI
MSRSLFKALELNDKHSFLEMLKEYTQNRHLTSAKKWIALYAAAASKPKYKECLELLLKYGVGVFFNKDEPIRKGKTALHIACENECDDNVHVLLHEGCNPDTKTNIGETALHIASYKGCSKIVEYLLNYSASINAQNKRGRTPLHIAAMSGQLKVIQLLLEKGADLQSTDSDGCLPLHLVHQQSGYFKIARLLLEHDLTTINSQDSEGNTPLMNALSHQDEAIEYLHFLLENGAKNEFCNKRGQTALHLAAETKNHEILPVILKITDMKWMEQCLSNSFIDCNVENDDKYFQSHLSSKNFLESHFGSLLKYALSIFDVKTLSTLLSSELPKSILQIPIIYKKYDFLYFRITIHSPLTYLFDRFSSAKEEVFNACLHLLLKHKITTLDDFNRVIPVKWPVFDDHFKFGEPFSIIFGNSDLLSKQHHFLNLLNENDVTTDYNLHCYGNNKTPFASFYDYYPYYYEPVMEAIRESNLEVLKLMIPNSVILEPDILVKYLFKSFGMKIAYTLRGGRRPIRYSYDTYEEYLYLISLKPFYFTQEWRPSSNRTPLLPRDSPLPPNSLHLFNPFEDPGPFACDAWEAIMQDLQPSAFTVSEEFSEVTLQQLCRTVIRQQLRGLTIEDNLRNFKQRIFELPLANILKDYLLFKN